MCVCVYVCVRVCVCVCVITNHIITNISSNGRDICVKNNCNSTPIDKNKLSGFIRCKIEKANTFYKMNKLTNKKKNSPKICF